MEKNKYTLITIIVLLVCILPLTIYGTYKHYITTTNFKRLLKFNDKLWFYNGKKLIGTYSCKSKSCDYAIYTNEEKSTMINNLFAFISDDEKIYLYNIKDGAVINEYDAIGADAEHNNYYIMQLDEEGNEKWGALEITDNVVPKIEPKYPSIYYLNGKYVAPIDGNNAILQANGQDQEDVLFTTPYIIKDFNDRFIIVIYETSSCPTCTDIITREMLYDYENTMYFANKGDIGELSFLSDYILAKDRAYYYLYSIDDTKQEAIIGAFVYEGTDKITLKKNEQGDLEIYAGNELQKTIEMNTEEW